MTYAMAVVYGAMHDDGRWYIGSTTTSLDCRRHSHYATALLPSRENPSKFHQALRTTEESEWTWGVHEEFTNVDRQTLLQHEDEYIRAFDSIATGFNDKLAVANHQEWARKNYQKNRDHILQQQREARAGPQNEKIKEWRRASYHRNGDVNREKKRLDHQLNKDKRNAIRREHTKANPEQAKATHRAWYLANRERLLAEAKAKRAAAKALTTPTT